MRIQAVTCLAYLDGRFCRLQRFNEGTHDLFPFFQQMQRQPPPGAWPQAWKLPEMLY
jgi:hypothetical protein